MGDSLVSAGRLAWGGLLYPTFSSSGTLGRRAEDPGDALARPSRGTQCQVPFQARAELVPAQTICATRCSARRTLRRTGCRASVPVCSWHTQPTAPCACVFVCKERGGGRGPGQQMEKEQLAGVSPPASHPPLSEAEAPPPPRPVLVDGEEGIPGKERERDCLHWRPGSAPLTRGSGGAHVSRLAVSLGLQTSIKPQGS